MNHRRIIERVREEDGEPEDARVFRAFVGRFGEVPSLGERSKLERGGQTFPRLHRAIHSGLFFSGPAARGKARFDGKRAGSRDGSKTGWGGGSDNATVASMRRYPMSLFERKMPWVFRPRVLHGQPRFLQDSSDSAPSCDKRGIVSRWSKMERRWSRKTSVDLRLPTFEALRNPNM
jgi:hypothetical protein